MIQRVVRAKHFVYQSLYSRQSYVVKRTNYLTHSSVNQRRRLIDLPRGQVPAYVTLTYAGFRRDAIDEIEHQFLFLTQINF